MSMAGRCRRKGRRGAALLALLLALAASLAGCVLITGPVAPRATAVAPTSTVVPLATTTPTVAPPTVAPSPTATPATAVQQALAGEEQPLFSDSFEEGLAHWEAAEGVTLDAGGHTDGQAARLTDAIIRTTLSTTAGTRYKAAFWVQMVAESGTDWGGFRATAESADWEILGNSGYLTTPIGEWRRVAFSFVATGEVTHLTIGYFGGDGRTMTALVDDVAVWAQGAENLPPELDAQVAMSGDGTLRYDAGASDRDGAVTTVNWDFGDGGRSQDAAGQYQAASAGSYTATLRVADDQGAVASQQVAWTWTGDGPALAVAAPAEGATVDTAHLTLRGTAGAGVEAVTVSRDDLAAAEAVLDEQGGWTATLELAPGNNRLLVQARTADGALATRSVAVRYVPAGELAVADLAAPATVAQWESAEITFQVDNSAASDPQLPYDDDPPTGLAWCDGVSVDVLFSPDDWQTIYRRPAYWGWGYTRAEKGGEEWLYPEGEPGWTARFAPPAVGEWRYRVEVREARGSAVSAEGRLTVTAAATGQHGPVRVAAADRRYFEYADGTLFLGNGTNIGLNAAAYSYDAEAQLAAMGQGNVEMVRWWIGGDIWGAAWRPWNSMTLSYDGYLPATGLALEQAYGDAVASLRLDADNPVMLQGWNTGHAPLIAGQRYRLAVRWRTVGVTGPEKAGQDYGVTVKWADWPTPGTTGNLPALIGPVHDDTPWHVAAVEFTAAGDLLPNLALILENTTGGAAYVDQICLQEVLPEGSYGPQLLRGSDFGALATYDDRRAAGVDAVLAAAAEQGVAVKLVIGEKNDPLLNLLDENGLVDAAGGHYAGGPDTPMGRLHSYYWRYLMARYGASNAVHSWELVNEGGPDNAALFALATELATAAAADGNPHPASTSTWAGISDLWGALEYAALSYVDFHAGVRGTGWLEPKEELAADSAGYMAAYDAAVAALGVGKPVVWGEQSIDQAGDADQEDPDVAVDSDGVWLHKLVWARCGPGGTYPLYWFTDSIRANDLYGVYGAWNRFMADVPLNDGGYADAAAQADGTALRVLGQKNLATGRAYLWIDNRADTWRAVVDGQRIPAAAGGVTVDLGVPGAAYTATWYDTATGLPTSSETVRADDLGRVRLTVAALSTDTAVQIAPAGG